MAKYLHNTEHSPIRYLCKRNNLSLTDVCRVLGIAEVTMQVYIKKPFTIRLQDICTMAGLFGISVLELVYLLSVNKPQSKKVDKVFCETLMNNAESLRIEIEKGIV